MDDALPRNHGLPAPSRREFLAACGRTAGAGALATAGAQLLGQRCPAAHAAKGKLSWVEAKHYRKEQYDRVTCEICPRKCRVDDRERGYCATRENRGGKYYTLVYNRVCSVHSDPIEKKPLFHFLPGTDAFSLSTAGCCLECQFCQNYELSQFRPEQVENVSLTPRQVAEGAKRSGAPVVAFTYGEPVVYFEYAYDCAVVARRQGLRPVVITSGYVAQKPLKEWCKVVDAVKVDLKAFTDSFYRDICGAQLKPVLDTIVTLKKSGVWLELVYLVVPTLNDNVDDIRRMSKWLKQNIGTSVPVHFTRFHPTYKLTNLPATPAKTLDRCVAAADSEGLKFVYVGNVPGHPRENTKCPKCREPLLERTGFVIRRNDVVDGKCKHCGETIPGVWR